MSKSRAPGPRELGKRRTRDALLDAALASFAESGLDAPSLDAICARAGCTRGAFYVHFEDRDQLIAAAMERRRADVLATLLAGPPGAVRIVHLLEAFGKAAASGAFPIPGAVRSAELLAACRRSKTVRRAHLGLLKKTLALLESHVQADQVAGALSKSVDSAALATLLLVLEAGTELLLDFGLPLDVEGTVRALTTLLASPEVPAQRVPRTKSKAANRSRSRRSNAA